MSSPPPAFELPLFPLQSVLFPDGLLSLKVFETRYLDLVTASQRDGTPFGVVAVRPGSDAAAPDFEDVGTVAEVIDVNAAVPGILQVRCRGTERFRIRASRRQDDGLWVANARSKPPDPSLAPDAALLDTVKGLANAIATLKAKGSSPFLAPYRFDDAGWVANRWCEILPIPLAAKQKLMELPDASVRLRLVNEFLRSKGVVA